MKILVMPYFFVMKWEIQYIFNIDLNNINLHNNFDEDDPGTIIIVRCMAWHIKFEKRKVLKEISEQSMQILWHTKRWWNLSLSKDEKKQIEPIFTKQFY